MRCEAEDCMPFICRYADVLVTNKVRDHSTAFAQSIFCLSPYGHGFGIRLTLAMAHGKIYRLCM